MTKEQAVNRCKEIVKTNNTVVKEARKIGDINTIQLVAGLDSESIAIETVLNMLKEKDRQIDLIKEYAHQEIEHYTETIEDYIDDDKERNKDYIKELKEEREHWKDIERILENKLEELYMNWWKYGLYE